MALCSLAASSSDAGRATRAPFIPPCWEATAHCRLVEPDHRESRLAWLAAGLLQAMTMIGYVLSRTTGLPGATDDIGTWSERLGLASLLIEGCLVLLCAYRLLTSRFMATD